MARKRLDAPVATRRIIITDIGRSVSFYQPYPFPSEDGNYSPSRESLSRGAGKSSWMRLSALFNGAHNGLLDLEEHELDRICVNYSILAKKPGTNSTRY